MQTLTLRTTKAKEKLSSDELMEAGDFCITSAGVYNSDQLLHAIVLKCPYCGMDMMSTGVHRITLSRFKRLLSRLGFSAGITVRPQLQCPYHPGHSFLITNGRITPNK